MSTSLRPLLTVFSLFGSLIICTPALAAVFSSSGTTAGDPALNAAIDDFRNALGADRRTVVWDGVQPDSDAPDLMPVDRFAGAGTLFTDPTGVGTQVSGDQQLPTFPTNPASFGNLNSNFPSIFAPFSGDQIFTAIGGNAVDVTFVVPGTTTPGLTRGFGAVLLDVDLNETSSLTFFDVNNIQIGATQFVPGISGDKTFSFLGQTFDDSIVARVRIVAGNFPLFPGVSDNKDYVAIDDVILGTPVAVPEPSTWFLVVAGLGAVAWLRRRRQL